VAGGRYPETELPIVAELPEHHERFAELREDYLLQFGYNTARAYWGDLNDLLYWALERDKDVLQLTDRDIRQYLTLLRRRKYSPNTLRRRVTSIRAFYKHAEECGEQVNISDLQVAWKRRRGTSA
jgi:site-specific recombinase XerD